AAVFRIPGKCKTPASVLDQRICKVKDAQMIFHEQKIRIDLRHVSIGGRIEKEKRDIESVQHLDIFRVKQLEADDPCCLFLIKAHGKAQRSNLCVPYRKHGQPVVIFAHPFLKRVQRISAE